ncbi:MAG: glycosyltransferase [Taibaiella sp.]|nr:glycosyltransferase [Taibaiella sp.]
MKIAFVHDWFKANGGAEKVAGEILDIYEKEDVTVYTLFDKFHERDRKEILKNHIIKTSLLQQIPFIEKIYRYLLPVMPWLMKRFNLNGYDMIISTSHAVAKGIGADPKILNICYCHSPMRYVWDMYDDYVAHHAVGRIFFYKWFIHYIRKWDLKTAANVHYFIANSEHVRRRIQNSYHCDAKVIYPPVRTGKFSLYNGERKDYYLCLGRFVPYKKIDMVVRAFQQMPDKKLILIGDGYGTKKFTELLKTSPNIEWLGYKLDNEMIRYIQEAKACIFAAKEDFGIMCVEVQACGTPVIALKYGGYIETVTNGQSGYFFDEQTEASVIAAVTQFEHHPLTNYEQIRQNSLKFSDERFRQEMSDYVRECHIEFYRK